MLCFVLVISLPFLDYIMRFVYPDPSHDNVVTWKCFMYYWLFERRIHLSPVDCPQTRQNHAVPCIHLVDCLGSHWVANAMFALITPQITSKDDWRKSWMEDISNFINICQAKLHSSFKLACIFCKFCLSPSNDTLEINDIVNRSPLKGKHDLNWMQTDDVP